MIIYLLKSALCLAIFLAFYFMLLQREKMYQFNRLYLIGSAILSLIAPLVVIAVKTTTQERTEFFPIESTNNLFEVVAINANATTAHQSIDYGFYLVAFTCLFSILLLIRFIRNLYVIIQRIRKNDCIKQKNATIVLVDDTIIPHSFGRFIFVNKQAYHADQISNEILTHEMAHASQKHSLDIILVEALQVVFWFNPLYLFLKKAIQMNHEFLADNCVIKAHKNITEYQFMLLNAAALKNEYYLASNFNHSLTKKRIQMMTVSSKQSMIILKKLLVIPLLVGSIFLFAKKVDGQASTPIQKIEYTTHTASTTRAASNETNHKSQAIKQSACDWDGSKVINGISLPQYGWDSSITINGEKLYFTWDTRTWATQDGKVVPLDMVKEYKKMNAVYEKMKNTGVLWIHKSEEEKYLMGRLYSDLGGMWPRMTASERSQVKRPKNFRLPYVEFIKDGKSYYKKVEELSEDEMNLFPPLPPQAPKK